MARKPPVGPRVSNGDSRAPGQRIPALVAPVLLCCAAFTTACATQQQAARDDDRRHSLLVSRSDNSPAPAHSQVELVEHRIEPAGSHGTDLTLELSSDEPEVRESLAEVPSGSLQDFVLLAQVNNPALRGLQQEVAAARAKVGYADKLPDPMLGANVFGNPIETAAGSQLANLTVMQAIPWLKRLDAQAQQACVEALAIQQVYEAERLRVIGDVRAAWFRLYVLGKQIETYRANQQLLDPLIETANGRVAAGQASQGDVLLGTLELSTLEEQLLTFEQQLVSTKSELNRLIGRSADSPVDIPRTLSAELPDWSHAMLQGLAYERQPAIEAARLRTQATRWGLEVARLKRRPDITISGTWFAMDDNRPPSRVVDVGRDAWSIGAQISVPLWGSEYDAIEQEAVRKHAASHSSVEDVMLRYDALLRDLWEQAVTTDATARLYAQTILPQARQTLQSDQQSYINGTVEFDRVIADFRNLLTLELGYHRSIGQLAVALARIQQAAGTDIPLADAASGPQPFPPEPVEPAVPAP